MLCWTMRSPVPALAVAAALGLCLLSSCYETTQALRYLSIRSKAESFDRALADPKTSPALRLLIGRARAARSFALGELGLKQTKNFTSVVVLDADRLVTVVQACAGLSFTRHLWSYPVVGKMPYRGYFDRDEAEKEAARLKATGLDTIARPVDAFSTLGWLSDPLFSFMSSYGEAEVADLVIHEMTHATIFLKGDRPGAEQFNEELSTFVGREGSLLYMSEAYGADSRQVADLRATWDDAASLAAYLAGTGRLLEAVYSSGAADGEKRRLKAGVIAARAADYKRDYPALFKGGRHRDFAMERINNAYIDLYRLYEGESSLYRDFFERRCGGDLRSFIQAVARIAKAEGDPRPEMRRLVGAAGGGT